jgi:hypothetical protein
MAGEVGDFVSAMIDGDGAVMLMVYQYYQTQARKGV